MKNSITVLFFLFLSASLFAQSIPTFCLSVGLNSARNLCGTATYDGKYVAAGIVDIGSNQNNFVAKCDGEGNILWSHDVGSDYTDDFYGIMETSDHSIIAVGLANGKMCMAKYDQDGNETWKKDIAVQTFDYLYDIIETSDGNYLLAGVAEDLSHGWYYCAVIKVTPDGDLVWNKNFWGTYHAETGYSITETADHRYVIGGYSSVFSNQYFLLSLDESGTIQWIKKSVDGGVAYDLVATSDSAVIAAGYICTASGCDANLSKIDASGNLVWSYSYGDSLFDRFYSIVELSDGGFAMAGDATNQTDIYHGFVVKCDSSGQMQWGKTTTNDREFRSIGNSGDGGIIASSTAFGGFGIVKIDADGNSCPDCPSSDYGIQQAGTTFTDWTLSTFNAAAVISSSAMSEVNITPSLTVQCSEVGIEEVDATNSFFISPNPADELAVCNWQFATNEKASLNVFDIAGKEFFKSELSNLPISSGQAPSEIINVSSWQNGIYLCELHSGNEIAVSKFIVQH